MLLLQVPASAWAAAQVLGADLLAAPNQLRVVIESDHPIRFRVVALRNTVTLELQDVERISILDALPRRLPAGHPHVQRVRVLRGAAGEARLQFDLKTEMEPRVSVQERAGRSRLVLEMFPAAAAPDAPDELFAEASVNLQPAQNVLVLRQKDGRLLARAADLQRWRLLLPSTPAFTYGGEDFYPLHALAGLTYRFDERRQALTIQAPPSLFAPTALAGSLSRMATPMRPPPGGFLNYDIFLNHTQEQTLRSGVAELGAFGALGVGVTSFVATPRPEGTHLVRLDSTWTYDRPEKVDSFRFGDALTGVGSWARSVRFGGAQWSTNFATQPGLVTFPLPQLVGEAVVPSTVDLYVNDALRLRREVPSGPFTIQDLPVVTGRGEARVVVRDLLGREQTVFLPYYATPRLLQRGLHDFSYEAGAVRENFSLTSADYGRPIAAGTHRYGFSDRFTGEARGELAGDQKTGGLGGAWLVPSLGVVSASAAGSRADAGKGALLGLAFERQGPALGFGVNTQSATERFVQLGLQPGELAPRQQSQAFLSVGGPVVGSFGLSYTTRRFRDRPDIELASASYGVGISRFAYLNFTVLRSYSVDAQTSATLTVVVPLGVRTSANLTSIAQRDRHQTLAQIQQNLPAGEGFGYRLLASTAGPERREGSVAYQSRIGTYTLEAGKAEDVESVRAGATGGIAFLGGGLHLARRMSDSFALVEVPQQRDVRVYADHQLIGRTDAAGTLFLPRLRPYEPNRIAIEQADLPLDMQIEKLESEPVPYFRSGLVVRFGVSAARSAVLTVLLENGEPLPAGAVVRTADGRGDFAVGMNGEVYVTGLEARNRLRATWSGRSCEFDVPYAASPDPQPHLGRFVCKVPGR